MPTPNAHNKNKLNADLHDFFRRSRLKRISKTRQIIKIMIREQTVQTKQKRKIDSSK